jgi:hypothetical protein
MMGMQAAPAQLFYDFCLDDHVPEDLSLSETQSCWQLISNRAMLLPYARGL